MSDVGEPYAMPAGRRKFPLIPTVLSGILMLAVVLGGLFWFVIRVEVHAEELLVLVNKTGKRLPPELADEFGDQVVLYPELVSRIAALTEESEEQIRTGYKGIRYETKGESRYFPNPYSVKAVKMRATSIGQDEIGVLIRKFGKPLPFPKTVATEPDERGPEAEFLTQGRHYVNLLAYDVQRFDVIQIPEGHVGVVTLLSGDDPVEKNTYTVREGEKGVQAVTLPPGREDYNPYLKQIEIVDVRSHKYDMLGDDAILFPSGDSFTIAIEGSIEWALRPDSVARVTVEYGDEEDILSKIILPNARSISRIQGSKLKAREFISGKTRTAFQDHLLQELRRECWTQGVDIKSALVRDIQPPAEIAALISQREQADQEMERSTNQKEEAKSEALLVEQQELQEQNKAIGDARRDVVTMVKEAEQRKVVAVTKAQRQFEVAKLELEAAEKLAAAIRSRGQAEANVVLFNYKAKAEPLKRAVAAFGGGARRDRRALLHRRRPAQTLLGPAPGVSG